ncbi:MAG: type II toxin-antitoxin system VapC family toxin [Thermomicrobiales bacterium]
MSVFYFDSSALVKRYLRETGSVWVAGLTDPAAGHRILVADVTLVEIAAAIARGTAPARHILRARDRAVTLVRRHFTTDYETNVADRLALETAIDLTQRHRLRAYDAIQLATQLATNAVLLSARLPSPIFITAADNDLVAAARSEGLTADDAQNLHP